MPPHLGGDRLRRDQCLDIRKEHNATMENRERHENKEAMELEDLLLVLGGAAMVLLGAGLMLSHPLVKRYVDQFKLNDLAQGALPRLERFLKLRA
jgi:hypothetical protein